MGISSHKGGSIAILSDNGTEFKIIVLNDGYEQPGINPFIPTATQELRVCTISLREHLLHFWTPVI